MKKDGYVGIGFGMYESPLLPHLSSHYTFSLSFRMDVVGKRRIVEAGCPGLLAIPILPLLFLDKDVVKERWLAELVLRSESLYSLESME